MNKVLKIISEVNESKYTNLDLSNCNINNDGLNIISRLSELTFIKSLNLCNNNISNIIFLENFTELTELYIGNNNIHDINPLRKLESLNKLHLSNNQISDIQSLENLLDLNFLNLSNNSIENVEYLKNLVKLETLKLDRNKIVKIDSLENLDNLKHINLISNNIVDLRPLLSLIKNKFIPIETKTENYYAKGIYIRDNNILLPPLEIISSGHNAIVNYIKELKKGERELNEAKVIFIGDGGAGKTSLLKRLSDEDFDNNEEQTHGIVIKHNIKSIKSNDIHIRYWDFGGQEIMHATHQFFLTKRSVYILVLDSRKEDHAEYWLKHIQYFGGGAPTIIVLNKTDENPTFQLNQKHLNSKYPFIVDYHRISCKDNLGIKELENVINEEIWDLDLRKEIIPESWFNVKEIFEKMDKDFISHSTFTETCHKHNISDREGQSVLLGFLHDLGIIFYYEKMKIYNTNVLNPEWLTNAVYKILNSKISAKNNGFCFSEIDRMLNYNGQENIGSSNKLIKSIENTNRFDYRDKYNFIVEMMKKFELCYQLTEDKYIIPELLPDEQNDYKFSENDHVLNFIIKYDDFLPSSIIPRLMVRLNKYIYKEKMWKTGMVLKITDLIDATANIIADKDSKKIFIAITGEDKRKMLKYIRDEIKEINNSFSNLKVIEYIPLPDKLNGEDILVEYEELLSLETFEEKNYVSGKLKKKYDLNLLLNGYESEEKRNKEVVPFKIFISYSKYNIKYLEDFKSHLMSLVRIGEISIWDDKNLIPGENWDKSIKSKINEADIFILLVTDKLVSTDYVWNVELPIALERELNDEIVVIPIIVDFCNWQDLNFAKNQVLPPKGTPISDTNIWVNENQAWEKVILGIKKLISETKEKKMLKEKEKNEKNIHIYKI